MNCKLVTNTRADVRSSPPRGAERKPDQRLIIPDVPPESNAEPDTKKLYLFKRRPVERNYENAKTKPNFVPDIADRKKLYDRYTIRRTSADSKKLPTGFENNIPGSGDDSQSPTKCNVPTSEVLCTTYNNAPEVSKNETIPQRRSIIKNFSTLEENNSRIYKAVTFVDNKDLKPLHVKIPMYAPKKEVLKEAGTDMRDKNVFARLSLPQTRGRIRRRPTMKKKVLKSNETPTTAEIESTVVPPGVARWAPSCLNPHTKPYYEAWVDTTLAAVTKGGKRDVYLKQKKFLQSISKAIEWEPTAQPLYDDDIHDERFTGKINIRR